MQLQPISRFQSANINIQPATRQNNQKPFAQNQNTTFSGSTSAGRPIRRIRNVPCAFSNITTLSEGELNRIRCDLQGFGAVRKVISYLRRYADKNMLRVEKLMFEHFSDEATYSRTLQFPDLLQNWYSEALIRLRLEEIGVIKDIEDISSSMSPETEYAILKETADCRKLITDNNPQKRFKRKNILIALGNIKPKTEEEAIIMEDLMDRANYLPSSGTSENAFIVKYAHRSHEEIANRLIRDSLLTIDHLLADSKGGPNNIGNFAGVSAGMNNLKGDSWLKRFIRRFPEVIDSSQSNIDFFIDIINNGKFRGNQAYPYKMRDRYSKESDGIINLDLSLLKYTEEDAYKLEEVEKIN